MDINFLLIILIISLLNQSILNKRCDKYGGNFFLKDRQGPFTNTGLTCGKSNPKKQEDCTKYGTDSGMYCCWIANDENDNNGKCLLISEKKVERSGIDGCAQFSDSYWSCGNFSEKIKMNTILVMFITCYFFLVI